MRASWRYPRPLAGSSRRCHLFHPPLRPRRPRRQIRRSRSRSYDATPRGLAVAAVVLLVSVVAALYVMRGRDVEPRSSEQSATVPPLADWQVTQLTTSGIADRPAISPDGRYVVYVQHDGDGDSLWSARRQPRALDCRARAGGDAVRRHVRPMRLDRLRACRPVRTGPWEVWRVPFLGGTPRLFIANVATPSRGLRTASVSRSCARRSLPRSRPSLVVADADGGQERVSRRVDGASLRGCRWSRRGARISLPPGRPTASPSRSPPREAPEDRSSSCTAGPARFGSTVGQRQPRTD